MLVKLLLTSAFLVTQISAGRAGSRLIFSERKFFCDKVNFLVNEVLT